MSKTKPTSCGAKTQGGASCGRRAGWGTDHPGSGRCKQHAAPQIDLHARGARVLSVFGMFNSRVLIEMGAGTAVEMFPDGALATAGRTDVIEAVERDIETLRERSPELADSALAASAVVMAYELADPYNSATAKSNCSKVLADAMRELRDLAPPEKEKDEIDRLAEQRQKRRTRAAAAKEPAAKRRRRAGLPAAPDPPQT